MPAPPRAHGYGCAGDPDNDVQESNGQTSQRWVSLVWGGGVGASRKRDLLAWTPFRGGPGR